MIAALVGLPCYLESGNLFAGIWAAVWSGSIAGAVKELCDDNTDGNNWNFIEFGLTVMGTVVIALIIVLLHVSKG